MIATSVRAPAKPSRDREVANAPVSHVGRAATITGTLDTEGTLHIHGNVVGRINAGVLFLGNEGYVEGDIVARDVHVEGRFNGRIFALNVTLDSSAEITGRIFHHTVTVARGARIDARMPWRPINFFETLETLPETQP